MFWKLENEIRRAGDQVSSGQKQHVNIGSLEHKHFAWTNGNY